MACYLGRRGYKVDLYEAREDLRQTTDFRGRSVNLAISVRALSALSKLNLASEIKQHCIPMKARMIHNLDGSRKAIPYGKQDQHINSISRNHLNKLLLNIAEQFPSVRLHFNQKLSSIDFNKTECVFEPSKHINEQTKPKEIEFSRLNFELYSKGIEDANRNSHLINDANDEIDENEDKNEVEKDKEDSNVETIDQIIHKTDVIIGADGAFSKVRYALMKKD